MSIHFTSINCTEFQLKVYYFSHLFEKSQIMRVFISIIVLIGWLVGNSFAGKVHENLPVTSPVKPPFFFAGDFGELRPNHFHSGLDFRTQGQTGLPVFAVKDGYISRINISPTGYGNALYLNHPDGTTSVYGHLLKFHPKIDEYVKEKQYDRESFQINLTPLSGTFPFHKGDIIAWSGNSGSSGGPHLHFEIRDTQTERAYNPIFYHFGITDNSAPKIIALYAYPLTENSSIYQDQNKKRLEAVPVPGGYRLKNNAPIAIHGKIGFGIQAEDFFNGTGLKCGIYSATLFCDKKEIFGFKMDNFSFENARYANAQSDYEEHLLSNRWVERLFRQPGNYLDIYYPENSNGILNLDDNKGHEFEIVVYDAFKNKTSLKFRTIDKKCLHPNKPKPFTKEFFFDKANSFENDQIRIELPKGALYDNLKFNWKSAPRPEGCYSELQQISSRYIPIHIPCSISIKCENLPEQLTSKALIVSIDPVKGGKTAIGGEYSRGWVTAKSGVLGNFSVMADQTPPRITALSIKDQKTLTDPLKIQFKISDNLSGIKSYRGEIDGKWVLFEYDEKTGVLTYSFDKQRMVFGKSHLLRLVVTDNRENSSEYKAIIYK